MLRIERSGGSGNLLIAAEKREFFATTSLRFAFLIAISFHVFGLLLFRIVPFTLFPTFQHPIIKVDVESFAQECRTIPIEKDTRDPQEQIFPIMNSFSSLTLSCDWLNPILEKRTAIHYPIENFVDPHVSGLNVDIDIFQSEKNRFWINQKNPFSLENLKWKDPVVDLRIGGRLSQVPLQIKDPLLDATQPFRCDRSIQKLRYSVQMNEKTGEIIWFQKKVVDEENEEVIGKRIICEELAKKIIRNFRFEVNEGLFYELGFISGELDFTFFGNEEQWNSSD